MIIEYLKEDWSWRIPYRLHRTRHRGLSRPAYALLCTMYYAFKSALLIYFYFCFRFFKFVFWDVWKGLYRRFHPEDVSDDEEEIEEENLDEEEIEELPFCQLFAVGSDMSLMVDHVEMCPDETAFIRVVDDEGYTPIYKRKVRRDKRGNRFIVFNSTNYYLDDKKTQPTIIKK